MIDQRQLAFVVREIDAEETPGVPGVDGHIGFLEGDEGYLTNYRINEAARQLICSDKKINQIAADVGYRDCDYFIRKFIETMGCTPSKYRKTHPEK